MQIISWEFVVFTLIVWLVHRLLPAGLRNVWLLLASYVFLASWDMRFFVILLATTLLNYLIARLIGRRKSWLWVGLALNIAAFVYFRVGVSGYAERLWNALSMGSGFLLDIDFYLPLGFSFYVMQAISYLVDVSRGRVAAESDPVNFAVYLAYFPKLVAGPIERAGAFLPQLAQPRQVTGEARRQSIVLILVGITRKVIFAAVLYALIPADFFSEPEQYTRVSLLAGLFLYGFWLYNDFAGYSDIARGVSGLFGIQLMRNFTYPFFASNFTEFWNSWHISLSHWLRDYLFYPLNRALRKRGLSANNALVIVLPPLLTMLVSGMWHAFSVSLLLWGGLYGLYLILERVIALWHPRRPITEQPLWRRILGAVGVVGFVSIAWLPFAAGGAMKTVHFVEALFSGGVGSMQILSGSMFSLVVVGLSLLLDGVQKYYADETMFLRLPLAAQGFLLAVLLLSAAYLLTMWGTPFEPNFLYQSF